MKLKAVLEFSTCNIEEIYRIAKCEEVKKNRSEISIQKKKNCVLFIIKAEDLQAFKSSFNLVVRILDIYQRTYEVLKENVRGN